MKKMLWPWDAQFPITEQRLAVWFSSSVIALLLVFLCAGLLVASMLVPAWLQNTWPMLSGVGQNTLLALLLFALSLRGWQLLPTPILMLLLILPFLLAAGAHIQWWLNWLPADGWYRLMVNTAGDQGQWPGRMSTIEAQLLILMFIAGMCLRVNFKGTLVLAGVLIAGVALSSAARWAASLFGMPSLASNTDLADTLNPWLAVLLFLTSLALARLFFRHRVYLSWQSQSPGQSAFLRVAVLFCLLLVAAATATLGYARQGQIGAAAIVLMMLSAFALLVIYVRIVSVVEERRRAESIIIDRETALEKAQEIALIGSWRLFWPQGDLSWSKETHRIFGVPSGTPVTLDSFMLCVHPDDLAEFQQRWRSSLEGEVYDFEHRILVAGLVKWVRERADFKWNADRSACECIGSVQDITDSKLKEIELLRSRELVRKLAAHNERIRERERTRIARELHDEMGQHLTALRLQAAMLQIQLSGVDAAFDEQVQDFKVRIDNTIEVVRTVAASLRPPALDAGLDAASRWLLESYVENAGISTRLECHVDEVLLSDALRTVAFRILQESLTNVIRHSHASRVIVSISQNAQALTVSVSDNGQGFNPDEVSADRHFGLMGIRERALNFHGAASINSKPGKGCRISVTLPLLNIHNSIAGVG